LGTERSCPRGVEHSQAADNYSFVVSGVPNADGGATK
jgi:hypothetical protein